MNRETSQIFGLSVGIQEVFLRVLFGCFIKNILLHVVFIIDIDNKGQTCLQTVLPVNPPLVLIDIRLITELAVETFLSEAATDGYGKHVSLRAHDGEVASEGTEWYEGGGGEVALTIENVYGVVDISYLPRI